MNGLAHGLVQVPSGVQCFVGDEARRRRAIEERVVAVFEGWGYEEPLSVRDFQRRHSRIRMTRRGLVRAAPGIVRVARAEGFLGHARSVLARTFA